MNNTISAIPTFYDNRTGKQVRAYSFIIRGKSKGKNIYYVRLRNRNGEKLPIHFSTHCTCKNDAEKFVIANYDKIIDDYNNSIVNREGRRNKVLHKSLNEYFKNGSKWLRIDREFGIERMDKGNKDYDSLIERHLIPYLNEHRLFNYSDIDAKALYDFQIDCIEKGISNKNINDMLFAVKLLYNRLTIQGTIKYNPFIGINQVKRAKSKEKGFFNITDVKGLFNTNWENHETEYMFNLIAFSTGLRNSEIRMLKTTDLEFINDIHFINVTNARENEKGVKTENAYRKIPLTDFVYTKIKAYIKKYNRNGLLFVRDNNTVYSAAEVSMMIDVVSQKLEYDKNYLITNNITFHSWRHLFSTILYENGGISSDWIEYFMGHKQKGVKAIYTHLHNVDGIDACTKLVDIISTSLI